MGDVGSSKVGAEPVKKAVKTTTLPGVDAKKTAIKDQASKLWDALSKKRES